LESYSNKKQIENLLIEGFVTYWLAIILPLPDGQVIGHAEALIAGVPSDGRDDVLVFVPILSLQFESHLSLNFFLYL